MDVKKGCDGCGLRGLDASEALQALEQLQDEQTWDLETAVANYYCALANWNIVMNEYETVSSALAEAEARIDKVRAVLRDRRYFDDGWYAVEVDDVEEALE